METEAIVDAVRDYLDTDDWHYDYVAEHAFIRAGVSLRCKLKNARLIIQFRRSDYNVYMISPVSADPEHIEEVLRYSALANYGLANGNFEVDVHDGEIRYKSYVNCDAYETLPKEIIRNSINVCWAMMERYGDGFAALAMGFSDAETEIKKAEPSSD